MIICVLLPWLFTSLLWRWLALSGFEIRAAFLAANVISGLGVVFSTELLSTVQQFHFTDLLLFWGALTGLVLWRLSRIPDAFRMTVPKIEWTLIEKIGLAAAIFIVGVIGFIALYAPPNTWDAMTYHLARVGHWQQNRGVMNYPTNIIRQLVYLPYAEYVIAQWHILSGGDRFANLVQWSSMVLSAVGVSLIASLLGVSRWGQVMTAVLALTLPIGMMEASSTQNDYVVTALILSAACFILLFVKSGRRRWVVLAAVSAGLAAFTKGFGVMLTLPFVVMAFFVAAAGVRAKWLLAGAVLAAILVISAPFYFRLTAIDHNPFAAINKTGSVGMDRIGPRETISNVLRNVSTELASPWNDLNKSIETSVIAGHQALGIGVEDPATTFSTPYRLMYYLDEDYMPNPLHMALLLLAGLLFWFAGKRSREVCFYAAGLFGGILLFCVTVKWQPWISRFHLPLFILAMPLAGWVMERKFPRSVFIAIVLVAFCAGLHPLVLNNTRRLFSAKAMFNHTRQENYFAKHPWEYSLVSQVWRALDSAKCHELGLRIGEDDWDYTWRALGPADARIEHVGVANGTESFAYPGGEFQPCAVVDLSGPGKAAGAIFNGRPYGKVAEGNGFTVYFRQLTDPSKK